MTNAKPIDVELMRSLFEYAPELGGSCLSWKIHRNSNATKGKLAGSRKRSGYWLIGINGKVYLAHRIVWAVVYGEDPVVQVDHIHGLEAGNRVENLRLAIRNEADNNQGFRKKGKNNTSGYTGVSKEGSRWKAQLKVNGVQHYVGCFVTPEEAYAAYLEAKAKLHTFQPVPRETT